MNRHDPLAAVTEDEATGLAAEVFRDIREATQSPFVTSIWRILAMGPDLAATWNSIKPLYTTGVAQAELPSFLTTVSLPTPLPLVPGQLASVGVSDDDRRTAASLIAAYNRANGLSLLTLTSLFQPVLDARHEPSPCCSRPVDSPAVPPLPTLHSREDFDTATWLLLEGISAIGRDDTEIIVPTLWRHVGYHWPGLLALAHAGLSPLHYDGRITRAAAAAVTSSTEPARRLASLLDRSAPLAPTTLDLIKGYAQDPTVLARMVVIGHAIVAWLSPDETLSLP